MTPIRRRGQGRALNVEIGKLAKYQGMHSIPLCSLASSETVLHQHTLPALYQKLKRLMTGHSTLLAAAAAAAALALALAVAAKSLLLVTAIRPVAREGMGALSERVLEVALICGNRHFLYPRRFLCPHTRGQEPVQHRASQA